MQVMRGLIIHIYGEVSLCPNANRMLLCKSFALVFDSHWDSESSPGGSFLFPELQDNLNSSILVAREIATIRSNAEPRPERRILRRISGFNSLDFTTAIFPQRSSFIWKSSHPAIRKSHEIKSINIFQEEAFKPQCLRNRTPRFVSVVKNKLFRGSRGRIW